MLLGLEFFWFCIIILSFIAFAVLDGFDLGVGILQLTTNKDEDRRVFLNAIGPVWDGNSVWLIILSGGLLAGFPGAFATLFSSFYDLFMGILAGVVFRAVAIEFRSKRNSLAWRFTWDFMFFLSSLILTFGIGLILGNLIKGIPLDEQNVFIGNFSNFFSLYSVWLACTVVALFMMHGAIYLVLKTEGDLHDRLRRIVNYCIILFIIMYIVMTILTFLHTPYMLRTLYDYPWLFIVPILALLVILNIPREMSKKRDGWAFLSSCFSIILLIATFAISYFPQLIRSSISTGQNSVTIYNASASELTLLVLLIIAIIGVPLVLAYTIWVYRIFRTKVKLDSTSY